MTGTIGYEELRAGTVRQVAQLMAAAITAPKSGGQLFLAGKPNFMETVIIDDPGTRRQLAAWMRARGKERRERIWFRDADAAEAVDAILFVGLLPWPRSPPARTPSHSRPAGTIRGGKRTALAEAAAVGVVWLVGLSWSSWRD